MPQEGLPCVAMWNCLIEFFSSRTHGTIVQALMWKPKTRNSSLHTTGVLDTHTSAEIEYHRTKLPAALHQYERSRDTHSGAGGLVVTEPNAWLKSERPRPQSYGNNQLV